MKIGFWSSDLTVLAVVPRSDPGTVAEVSAEVLELLLCPWLRQVDPPVPSLVESLTDTPRFLPYDLYVVVHVCVCGEVGGIFCRSWIRNCKCKVLFMCMYMFMCMHMCVCRCV